MKLDASWPGKSLPIWLLPMTSCKLASIWKKSTNVLVSNGIALMPKTYEGDLLHWIDRWIDTFWLFGLLKAQRLLAQADAYRELSSSLAHNTVT